MPKLEKTDQLPVKPVYSQSEPGQPIDLGSMEVEFTHADQTYAGMSQVTMCLAPDSRVTLLLPPAGNHRMIGLRLFFDEKWDEKLMLREHGISLDVLRGRRGQALNIKFAPGPRESAI